MNVGVVRGGDVREALETVRQEGYLDGGRTPVFRTVARMVDHGFPAPQVLDAAMRARMIELYRHVSMFMEGTDHSTLADVIVVNQETSQTRPRADIMKLVRAYAYEWRQALDNRLHRSGR